MIPTTDGLRPLVDVVESLIAEIAPEVAGAAWPRNDPPSVHVTGRRSLAGWLRDSRPGAYDHVPDALLEASALAVFVVCETADRGATFEPAFVDTLHAIIARVLTPPAYGAH